MQNSCIQAADKYDDDVAGLPDDLVKPLGLAVVADGEDGDDGKFRKEDADVFIPAIRLCSLMPELRETTAHTRTTLLSASQEEALWLGR